MTVRKIIRRKGTTGNQVYNDIMKICRSYYPEGKVTEIWAEVKHIVDVKFNRRVQRPILGAATQVVTGGKRGRRGGRNIPQKAYTVPVKRHGCNGYCENPATCCGGCYNY